MTFLDWFKAHSIRKYGMKVLLPKEPWSHDDMEACWNAAIKTERERCAKIAEQEDTFWSPRYGFTYVCIDIADAIRNPETTT